jgi:hypothetical protein
MHKSGLEKYFLFILTMPNFVRMILAFKFIYEALKWVSQPSGSYLAIFTLSRSYSSLQGVSLQQFSRRIWEQVPNQSHINHFQVQKWKLVASTWVHNKSDATLRFERHRNSQRKASLPSSSSSSRRHTLIHKSDVTFYGFTGDDISWKLVWIIHVHVCCVKFTCTSPRANAYTQN